jgi:hypothetical protein
MHQSLRIGRDWLALAATAFLAANLLHGADHVRQEFAGFDAATFVLGTALTAAAAAVVFVALRRHPRAPLLAAVVGLAAVVLVSAGHIGSVGSASYVDDLRPDVLSWAVMLLEVAAGFLLLVVGLHGLRARARGADDGGALTDGLEPATPRRTSTPHKV